MPTISVYIRKDDLAKWKLINNKSELLHQAINRSTISPVVKKDGRVMANQTIEPPAEIDYQPAIDTA